LSEVQRELDRLGIKNDPQPDKCPECNGELTASGGMVGENLLYCPNKACDAGVVWEDVEGAIAIVY